jgi:DNA-binding MarR family transcriptional regulator
MKRKLDAPLELAPAPALGEVLDFMRVMWNVHHALQQTSKRMQRTIGVTGPQRLVIRIVGRFPGISSGHLSELLHVHPSTLTGVVKRLERQKLLRRRVDERDRRRLLLSLTDKGRSLDVSAAGTVEAAVQRALTQVSAKQLGAAREVLREVTEALTVE